MNTPAIRTLDLSKHFGRLAAVDGLDLSVQEGEIFGFLGPNGAGKSTTMRLLLNLIRPTRGEAWIMGVPAWDVERAHRLVSYVPGDVALWPQLTGAEALAHLGALAGGADPAVQAELIERLDLDPSVRIRSYSKGNRQKVALIAAFMTRPAVLLLDEPTVGLDPLMEAQFQALAREAAARGQTVFLSSHLLDQVEDVCDRVAILREGRLVEVSTLQDLRRLTTNVLDVTLTGPVPDLTTVPGVVAVDRRGPVVRVTYTGSPAEVVRLLAAAGISQLRSHEPTLEEVFLTYYDTSSEQRQAVAAAHDTGRDGSERGDVR